MLINEIFKSIQGEGSFLGMSCVFIRTQGCNLTCTFCDTKETWGNRGTEMTIADIVATVNNLAGNNPLVIITGGEPCMQKDMQDLVDQLLVSNFVVAMESNGTLEAPKGLSCLTVSPKPESGYKINPSVHPDELKYVVTETFNADEIITEGLRDVYAGKIWLQPDGNDMQNMWKKCYEIAMKDSRLRVGVQLHKLMEVK